MKSILAFRDSLTWGFRAGEWMRHAFEDLWPNVLGAGLGQGFRVENEDVNASTKAHIEELGLMLVGPARRTVICRIP